METKTVTLNGQEFFLRTWGNPALPRLLLLHGYPEFSGAWESLAPKLSGMFHCIAPDQRGFGQSWAPEEVGEYTTSKLVSDMVALIGNGGPVSVFGHDWGAAVAYGLAMFRPDLVDRLIIANGVHPVPFQREMAQGGAQSEASQYINYLKRADSPALLAADDCAKMVELFSAKMNTDWLKGARLEAYKREWLRPGRLRGMTNWYRASPLVLADPGQPVEMPDLPLDRLRVSCPHLLIWGMDDTALLPQSTEGLEDFCDDLTRVEVAGADHWIIHQEPETVADAVIDWVMGADFDIA